MIQKSIMKAWATLLLGMGLMVGTSLTAQTPWLDYLDANPDVTFDVLQDYMEAYYADRDKGRGSGYKHWKRFEWQHRSRLTPDGKVGNIQRSLIDAEQQVTSSLGTRVTNGYWSQYGGDEWTTGPSGYNGGMGRINCFGFHPTDPLTYYVGAPEGGLWRTTNDGSSWTCLTDGLPVLGVSGIQVHHTNPSTIYILTGDGDRGHTTSIGVLVTYDGGDTWFETDLQFSSGERGYKLKMHPTDPDIMFAVTNSGLYKTTDGWSSWTLVESGSWRDLEFKPGNPSIVYLSGQSTIERSIDGGDSFTPVTSSLPVGSSRVELAVTPDNPNYVYAVFGNNSTGFLGLYRSFDSGVNFSPKSTTPNILGWEVDGSDAGSQANSDLAIAVNPTDVSQIWVGGVNLWRSDDFGTTWTIVSHWNQNTSGTAYTHADTHWLEWNDGDLHVGSDGGAFRRFEFLPGVYIWVDISDGLEISQFYRMGGTPAVPGLIYSGAQDNGINKILAGGGNMEHVWGGDGMECMIDPTNSSKVWASTQRGNLRKSTDGGDNWTDVNALEGDWVTPFEMQESDPDKLYAGWGQVYRRDDLGLGLFAWFPIGGPTSNPVAMALGINNTNRLYAAIDDQIWMSNDARDGSVTWDDVTPGLPASSTSPITYIAVDPDASNRVFVTLGGTVAGDKVFRSTNSGDTWTDLSAGLPNVPINCIAYEPGSNDGIYVGTDIGVFYRNNDIGTWIPFRNGMPAVQVNELEINTGNNTIYAATFGRGIWSSSLYTSCPPAYILTDFNDPNPAGGFKFYEASTSISSNRTLDEGFGLNITYQAGNFVDLTTDFRTQGDVFFEARLGDCTADALVPYFNEYRGILVGEITAEGEQIIPTPSSLEMSLFPNPANDQTTLQFGLDEEVEIHFYLSDINGRLLAVLAGDTYSEGQHAIQIRTSELPTGTYLVHGLSGAGKWVEQLVVTR